MKNSKRFFHLFLLTLLQSYPVLVDAEEVQSHAHEENGSN